MREISFCVFTTAAVSRADQTPRRFVSEDLLCFYRESEIIAAVCLALALGYGVGSLIIAIAGR